MAKKTDKLSIYTMEPYFSIINILYKFQPRGLTLKELQYALFEKHYLSHVSTETHDLLDDTIKTLISQNNFHKYQIKKRNTEAGHKSKSEKAKTARSNLLNFLDRMMMPETAVIESYQKDENGSIKKYYRLSLLFLSNYDRLAAINAISWYPENKICRLSLKPNDDTYQDITSWVVFGVSFDFQQQLTYEERNEVSDQLRVVDEQIDELHVLIDSKIKEKWKAKLQEFAEKSSNEEFCTLLLEDSDYLLDIMKLSINYNRPRFFSKNCNIYDEPSICYGPESDIHMNTFYRSMGWIFTTAENDSPENDSQVESLIRSDKFPTKWRKIFENVVKGEVSTKQIFTKEEENEYCSEWCKIVFPPGCSLTKKDFEQLLFFCWMNRSNAYYMYDSPITFLRYHDVNKVDKIKEKQMAEKEFFKNRIFC